MFAAKGSRNRKTILRDAERRVGSKTIRCSIAFDAVSFASCSMSLIFAANSSSGAARDHINRTFCDDGHFKPTRRLLIKRRAAREIDHGEDHKDQSSKVLAFFLSATASSSVSVV